MEKEFKILQSLVGINTRDAFNFLVEKKVMAKSEFNDKSRGRTVENIIALLLDKDLPGSYKGSDFSLFEIKTIQIKYTKRDSLVRTCGDTPISEFQDEPNFFNSNIWDKLKSVLSVLVYNDIIVDILHFDGDKYKSQLKSDYMSLFLGENNHSRKDGKTWRSLEGKKNKFLARKDYKNYTSSIMMMGNQMIDLSESISVMPNIVMNNQSKYLDGLLSDKISNYKTQFKKSGIGLLEKLTMVSNIKELIQYRELINQKLDKMYLELVD